MVSGQAGLGGNKLSLRGGIRRGLLQSLKFDGVKRLPGSLANRNDSSTVSCARSRMIVFGTSGQARHGGAKSVIFFQPEAVHGVCPKCSGPWRPSAEDRRSGKCHSQKMQPDYFDVQSKGRNQKRARSRLGPPPQNSFSSVNSNRERRSA